MKSWIPFAMVVAGNVLYHMSQKSVPHGLAPFSVLAAAYLASLGLSVLLAARGGAPPLAESMRSPAVWGIGLAAFMVEAGYLLLYRAGGAVSTASLTASVCVFLLLIPVGLIWFSEKFTFEMGAGVVLCLAGLWLIVRASARG